MSHFIAHTISFSKDMTTFKVKGGDNNVVPRSNSWTDDIPIDRLYYYLNGGMIKLTGTSEKNCFIRRLVSKSNWGGNWNEENTYYHVKNNVEHKDYDTLKSFDSIFLNRLRDGLKKISNKKTHIVILRKNDTYIAKANPTHAKLTYSEEWAMKFTYYRAIEIALSYESSGAEPITF